MPTAPISTSPGRLPHSSVIQPELLIPFGGLLVAFGGLLLATCQFLKSAIKDSEIRLREAILKVKGELKALGDKLDRVVENFLASRS